MSLRPNLFNKFSTPIGTDLIGQFLFKYLKDRSLTRYTVFTAITTPKSYNFDVCVS